MVLEDSFILEKKSEADRPPLSVFSPNVSKERYKQFTLNDLIGELIIGCRVLLRKRRIYII
jgi:hypothetical protein